MNNNNNVDIQTEMPVEPNAVAPNEVALKAVAQKEVVDPNQTAAINALNENDENDDNDDNALQMTQKGGKRKLTEWNKFVLKIFREHRKTNKKYQYGQALKEASALKKAGKMSMKKEPKVSAKTPSKKTKSAKKSGKKSIKCRKEYV